MTDKPQFKVYLRESVVSAIKHRAIDEGQNYSETTEQILREGLGMAQVYRISTHTDFYGDCTTTEARQIAERIAREVEAEFGAETELVNATGSLNNDRPDIDEYVEEHWLEWFEQLGLLNIQVRAEHANKLALALATHLSENEADAELYAEALAQPRPGWVAYEGEADDPEQLDSLVKDLRSQGIAYSADGAWVEEWWPGK